MAAIDDDFDFLVATARRLIDHLSLEVDPLASEDERGTALAKHITETLRSIRAKVEHEALRFKAAKTETAKSTYLKNLRFCISSTWGIHDAMPWLESPHRKLDPGTLFFIDEAALAMIDAAIEGVPTESGYYMYWTLSWPFEELWEQLGEDMPRGTRPIILAYPPHEAASALLHGNFAHELGHSAVDHHGLLEAVVAPLRSEKAYTEGLANLVAGHPNPTAQQLRVKTLKRVESWIEELLCDQLALAYLGPSFLFCFAGMVLPVTRNEPQDRHPNATMRIHFLLNSVQKRGWRDIVENQLPSVWRWFEYVADGTEIPGSPATDFVRRMAKMAEEPIRIEADRHLGGRLFDIGAYICRRQTISANCSPTTSFPPSWIPRRRPIIATSCSRPGCMCLPGTRGRRMRSQRLSKSTIINVTSQRRWR